jgi:signal transduction histidine kinase
MMMVPNRADQDPSDLVATQHQTVNETLALGRLLAAVAALVTTGPPLSASIAGGFGVALLVAYVALAVGKLIDVRHRPPQSRVSDATMHIVDVAVAVAVAASLEATGAFLILSLYTLLAAGVRWGFAEALLTALTAVLLLSFSNVAATPVRTASAKPVNVEMQLLPARSLYVLIAGLLAGYLADREKRLRTEAVHIAALTRCADVRGGLKRSLGGTFAGIARLFGARRVVLVAWQPTSETLVIWDAAVAVGGTIEDLRGSKLDAREAPAYALEPTVAAWHLVRRHASKGDRFDIVAVDDAGQRMKDVSLNFSPALLSTIQPFDSLLSVPLHFAGQEWTGRLFLVDPALRFRRLRAVTFAVRIVRHLAPAMQNVAALAIVRAAAATAERARIARELHDGVIQGVLGVEMHVAALMRRLTTEAPAVARELAELSGMLRQQVIELRELLQEMHPIEVNGDQLVDLLADFVQRFQRETGINARLITQLDRVPLPPRACREMARILSEALINVRRHSGASHVFVRLSEENGGCHLSIEDDGRGFPFSGRRSEKDLEASREGPFVITQRIRAMGGKLTVESDPGHGARLEVAVPVSRYGIPA